MVGTENTQMIEVVWKTKVTYGPSDWGFHVENDRIFHFGMDPYGKWIMHEYHGGINNWIRSIIGVNEADPFLEPLPSPPVVRTTK